MASTSSAPDRRTISFTAFSEELAERRAAAGDPELPRNSGERRTESKKALLRALKNFGAEW